MNATIRKQLRAAGIRPPNAHPEQDLQIRIAAHLDKFLPEPYWYTAIDHSFQGERRGGTLRRMGVKKGVLDMGIFGPDRFVGWLENKSAKGTLKPEQEAFIQMALAFGHRVAVCRSLEDAVRAVASWGIVLLTEPRSTALIKRGLAAAIAEAQKG